MARYPLDPLRSLRKLAVDAGARALGEAVRRTAQAQSESDQAQRVLTRHRAARQGIRVQEWENLQGGDARIADLAAGAAWEEAASRVEQSLQERVCEAEERLAGQQRVEVEARRELAASRASARVIERHRQAHLAELERRAELAREEDAGDVWSSVRARERRT